MGQLARFASGAPWEPIVAYSRAVRAGDFVAVSGTTAFDERGIIVGAGQMYVQARQALLNIQRALEKTGLSMRDVVRTRMYVTDISRFGDAARAHHEFFSGSPPASTMVEVRRLVNPAMLIEIEADGYASSAGAAQPAQRSAVKPSLKAKSKAAVKKRPPPKAKKRK